MEIWKDIEGYEGLYQVSNKGRIRSWYKKGGGIRETPLIRKQQETKEGYKRVGLRLNGIKKSLLVSRLVGFAFVENPDNKPEINHKDGIKSNNEAENLEWCTRSENIRHGFDNGLYPIPKTKGIKNGMSELTENEVLQIRSIYEQGWATHKEIANAFNISRRHAGNIIQNKRWSHL